jgi:hypothetical protein
MVEAPPFMRGKEPASYQGTTLQAAEKPNVLEGDGLQAVHNC